MPRDPVLEPLPPDPDTYLVGGSVRDWVQGLEPMDLDLATGGDAMALGERIARKNGGRPVRIGRPPFVLIRVMGRHHQFDITPLSGGTIDSDLANRDFTINAMALPATGGPLIDPFGGCEDLANRRLHPVHDRALGNDAVRILRAFRLCSQFHLRLSSATHRAIQQYRDRLDRVAPERIRDELGKLLAGHRAAEQFRAMDSLGVLVRLLPEVAAMKGCTQSRPHHTDVFEHTLAVLTALADLPLTQRHSMSGSMGWPWLQFAALFHDTGKPSTCQSGNASRIRCIGHEAVGARLAADATRRWRLSNRDQHRITRVVALHMRPWHLFAAHERAGLTARAKARFFRACGSSVLPVLALATADAAGKGAMSKDRRIAFEQFIATLTEAYHTEYRPAESAPPLVTGKDLIAMGLEPSPLFGRLLDGVRRAQTAGAVKDRPAALAWLRHRFPK